jgi:hypothetical protein
MTNDDVAGRTAGTLSHAPARLLALDKNLRAISKIGFWPKIKAEPSFNPQAY